MENMKLLKAVMMETNKMAMAAVLHAQLRLILAIIALILLELNQSVRNMYLVVMDSKKQLIKKAVMMEIKLPMMDALIV